METKITYLAVLNPKTEKLANCALFFMFRPTYRSGVGDAMMVSMQMFREVCILLIALIHESMNFT